MKKVFQSIVDKDKGDCWPAAIASLLNLHLEDVPHFNSWQWQCWNVYSDFLKSQGYKIINTLYSPNRKYLEGTKKYDEWYSFMYRIVEEQHLNRLKEYEGVDGYFYATVFSPKLAIKYGMHYTHAVIIDKDFNIVHDPNFNYKGLDSYPYSNTLGYNGVLQVNIIERI